MVECEDDEGDLHIDKSELPVSRNDKYLLRLSSKTEMMIPESPPRKSSSCLVNVQSLVNAFEDIGSDNGLHERPITVHVDSFTSDPFVAPPPSASPLQRSQSLKHVQYGCNDKSHNEITFHTNSTVSSVLKADNALRSFSSSVITSKEIT